VYLRVSHQVLKTCSLVKNPLVGILGSIVRLDLESGVSPASAKAIKALKTVFEALRYAEEEHRKLDKVKADSVSQDVLFDSKLCSSNRYVQAGTHDDYTKR